jgi:hypothetical protein
MANPVAMMSSPSERARKVVFFMSSLHPGYLCCRA